MVNKCRKCRYWCLQMNSFFKEEKMLYGYPDYSYHLELKMYACCRTVKWLLWFHTLMYQYRVFSMIGPEQNMKIHVQPWDHVTRESSKYKILPFIWRDSFSLAFADFKQIVRLDSRIIVFWITWRSCQAISRIHDIDHCPAEKKRISPVRHIVCHVFQKIVCLCHKIANTTSLTAF